MFDMGFDGVRLIARGRLAEVQQLLNYIALLEPDDVAVPHGSEVKILRGFFYVHLYAALERSANEAVQSTLRLVASHGVPANHYALSFGAVAARGRIQAFKTCSYKAYNENVCSIFSCLQSSDVMNIDDSQFSGVLQNVWTNSVLEVFNSLGLQGFVVEPRVRATIDEIVENRNKVAHGRESALVVGERYRSRVLRDKFTIVSSFIDSVTEALEEFYNGRNFIRDEVRSDYN